MKERRTESRFRIKESKGKGDVSAGVLISPVRASKARGRGERERRKAGRRASAGAGCD